MRQKIDGHIYDTDTAKYVANAKFGPDDNGWYEKRTLWVTRKGLYFIDYESRGGKYQHEEIYPVTEDEAKRTEEEFEAWNKQQEE